MKTGYIKLLLIAIGVVMLVFLLLQFIPWRILALLPLIGMLLFVFFAYLRPYLLEGRKASTPEYQPPPQLSQEPATSSEQEAYPDTQEGYNQRLQHYQEGYQAPHAQQYYEKSSSPEQEELPDYEQPQMRYPEQLPPMTTY